MQLILVTNCSGTKTAQPDLTLRARSLPQAKPEALAEVWNRRCESSRPLLPASRLYSGRAFKIALEASVRARANLFIVSAGFGLVHSGTALPPYSLTITPHLDSILRKAVKGASFSASEWWTQILTQRETAHPFKTLLKRHPSSLLVIAVTNPYLRMIGDELAALGPHLLERVRIVGPRSAKSFPKQLSKLVMPYTSQLNDRRMPIRGTEFDFASRAAAHFIDLIGSQGYTASVNTHIAAVRGALSVLVAPNNPARSSASNASLIRLISSFKRENTTRHKALRSIRNSFGYACGAERFELLWSSSK